MRAAILALLCLSAVLAASDAAPDLGKATAVLRIDDVRWLEREVVRITAAEGRDPGPLRRTIANALFRCRSLDGIDTARPALIAWRHGPSPLVAIIPVGDRRRFLDDFGAMPAGEAPLVRIGERDGTVVLSQNHESGLREYRLLIANGTAYLARTLDEVRALAANPPPVATPNRASVSLWSTGGWDGAAAGLAGLFETPFALPACPWLDPRPAAAAALAIVQSQITAWQWDFFAVGEGGLRIAMHATAREESPLAAWLAGQRNQSSRLLRVVKDARTALAVTGALAWQGQLAAFAEVSTPLVRERLGDAWTPTTQAAWRECWNLWQRAGDTAWALRIDDAGRYGTVLVGEQARAGDQLAAWDAFTGAATRLPSAAGERGRQRTGSLDGLPFSQAIGAADRYVLAVEEFGGGDAAANLARAADLAEQAVALEGDAGLLRIWCDLGRLALASPRLPPDTVPATAEATALVALGGPRELVLRAELPLRAIANVVAQMQPSLPPRTSRPGAR